MERSEVAHEDRHWIHLRLSAATCGALDALNLFLGYAEQTAADPNRIMRVPKAASFEEYTSFLGDTLFDIGAFSYSESPFVEARVGRYCSISFGLRTFGERHPIERVTSSSITYCYIDHYMKPQFRRAQRVMMDGRHAPDHPANAFAPLPTIGHDVWIGQDVQLARGITIGTGSVIAAGAVVTRSVEPYSVVGGNPARLIRRRFPSPLSEYLLATRWWDYHPEALWRFGYGDPASFCKKFERARERGELTEYPFRRYSWQDLVAKIDDINAGTPSGASPPAVSTP